MKKAVFTAFLFTLALVASLSLTTEQADADFGSGWCAHASQNCSGSKQLVVGQITAWFKLGNNNLWRCQVVTNSGYTCNEANTPCVALSAPFPGVPYFATQAAANAGAPIAGYIDNTISVSMTSTTAGSTLCPGG